MILEPSRQKNSVQKPLPTKSFRTILILFPPFHTRVIACHIFYHVTVTLLSAHLPPDTGFYLKKLGWGGGGGTGCTRPHIQATPTFTKYMSSIIT